MSESLDVVVNILSDTSFRVKQLASSLEDMEGTLKNINKTIEIETHKSWKKVVERDDLKVVCEADPKMIFHIEELASSSKKNADAILAFSSSFTKRMDSLESSLKKMSIIQREVIYANEDEDKKKPVEQLLEQNDIKESSQKLLNKKVVAIIIATNIITALTFYAFHF